MSDDVIHQPDADAYIPISVCEFDLNLTKFLVTKDGEIYMSVSGLSSLCGLLADEYQEWKRNNGSTK